jgi:ABC-2 type transport system permease protein
MRTAVTIARRELGALFVSPIAYVVAAAFLALSGYLFAIILITSSQATLSELFQNVSFILLFVAPLLTMRLLADEQKQGTLELLLTAPVRDWEVVLGKFLAALGLFSAILLCTLVYPLFLWTIGGRPDIGPIVSGYLGLILITAAMLAIGTLTSSLTENQIVAAVLAFAILLFLWLIASAGNVATGASAVLSALSLPSHYDDFTRGAINLEDVIYYLSLTIGALFIATRVLETRRYR